MAVFFIADTHFRHRNIIKHDGRPYSSVDEMNEALITNWNAKVKPNDSVYHLGDVGVGDASLGAFEPVAGRATHGPFGSHAL